MLIVVFKLLDVKPVHFAATHILGFCTKKNYLLIEELH